MMTKLLSILAALLLCGVPALSQPAQTEQIYLWHLAGPTYAVWDLMPSTYYDARGSGSSRFSLSVIDPFAGGNTLDRVVIPITAAITGSSSSQTISIGSTV